MSDLRDRVEKAILEGRLFSKGERVLVAVSGGVDSMVLLHALHSLAPSHGWQLVVAHFNHQLRGRKSAADQQLVQHTARRLGLPVRTGRGKVAERATSRRISVEMAGRELRHRFLARNAVQLGIRTVVMAHHADDQVELFLLRLLRGAGPEGLSGMLPRSLSPVHDKVQLARPLLGIPRAQIEAYAGKEGIRYRQDETNEHLEYDRNRIRHELIPILRDKFQPSLAGTVSRLISVLRAESDFVGRKTKEAFSERLVPFEGSDIALQRRWLRQQCFQRGILPDYELIERLRLHPGRRYMVEAKALVWRDEDGTLRMEKPAPIRFRSAHLTVELDGPEGWAVFGDRLIEWEVKRWMGTLSDLSRPALGMERFDADKIGGTIQLRHWQKGDRFQPIGMPKPVKVQDLFTNLKVPRASRANRVLGETASGQIFWVEGIRMSEGFKVTTKTQRCLEWRWRRKAPGSENANQSSVPGAPKGVQELE